MQIKKNSAPSETDNRSTSEQTGSNKKKSTRNTQKASTASSFTRTAKAVALGVLAAPMGAAARTMQSDTALALPGTTAQALAVPAHPAARRLLQDCGCDFTTSASNALIVAEAGYSQITMAPHATHGNSIAIPNVIAPGEVGPTADIYGFTNQDNLAMASGAYNSYVTVAGGDSQVLFLPQGSGGNSNSPGRVLVTLHGYTGPNPVVANRDIGNQPYCSVGTGGQIFPEAAACSPPPSPPVVASPPPPRPVSPPPVVASPPPPAPVVVSPPPPKPFVIVTPDQPPPPAPVVASPPPPQPASPPPVVVSPPPQPASPPPPSPPPPPPPHGGGGGAGIGAAIGGVAGGVLVVGAGVIAGHRYLKNRRATRMAEREQGVQMGAPQAAPQARPTVPPGPRPSVSAPVEPDFEFTV